MCADESIIVTSGTLFLVTIEVYDINFLTSLVILSNLEQNLSSLVILVNLVMCQSFGLTLLHKFSYPLQTRHLED